MAKSEAQTRSELIGQQLAQSGWNVKDPTPVVEEFDILTGLREGVAEPRTFYEGHQLSDYVLLGKDGKPLAVIEAKKTSRDAAIGREQPSSIATTSRSNLAVSCRSASIPMATSFTSGIWRTLRLERSLAFPRATIRNVSPMSVVIASR